MMPKEDGVSFLKFFRRGNTNTPVLMLTAMKEINSKINSFGIGCDDYLTKPFEPQELILRINKLLNPRVNNTLNKKIVFGDYEYNLNLQELRKNKELIKLTSIENEIMGLFCSNLNMVLSRDFLAKRLGVTINSRSIDVVITRLRKKLQMRIKVLF